MSRIGKLPVAIPQGVKGAVVGTSVTVEGPKGRLAYQLGAGVAASLENGQFEFSQVGLDRQSKANFGTARATVANMVKGVHVGWKRVLELHGVGYTAKMPSQNVLVLSVGFSHEVKMQLPESVKCTISKNSIELESPNKEVLGGFAAMVRAVQPPEPYLGKGIKYSDEVVRRKAGKTGKK